MGAVDYVLKDRLERLPSAIQRALDEAKEKKARHSFADKSIGHYYSTFHGNFDDNGNLVSIVGTVLDITERKQAEKVIQYLMKNLNNVFLNALHSWKLPIRNLKHLPIQYHTTFERLSELLMDFQSSFLRIMKKNLILKESDC